jgi:hypothetical protein
MAPKHRVIRGYLLVPFFGTYSEIFFRTITITTSTMSLAKRSLALWISSSLSTSASSLAWSPRSFGSRASVRYFRGGANTAFSTRRRNQILQTKQHRFMSSSSAAAVADNSDALRVALCQFPVTDNKEKNHQTASDYLQRAVDSGAKLVVLPEIWCSP